MHKDLMEIEVMLSNFEGRSKVSVREFLGYARMEIEEDAFREDEKYGREEKEQD